MSFPTVAGRAVEGLLYREAQVCLGPKFAGATYKFFLSGTSTPTNVYQNGTLTTAFPITGVVTANNFGRFPAIYLDPSKIYRVQFFNSSNVQQWQLDPYVSQLSTVGTSSLSAFGFQIGPTGEFTLDAPNSGGTGITLTLKSGAIGSAALQITGTLPGNSALIVNSSATTGAQTATFAATNKPGTATSSPAGWLPITCDGVQYYTPIWHGNPFSPYVSNPSANGEVIVASSVLFGGNGVTTATNGTATPGNWFTPAQTNVGANFWINITKTGGLSGLAFSAAQGAWTNIGAGGLTISSNAQATITGTYQLSTSVTGSPVVAAGTIALSNNNGVQSPTYNVATPIILAGNGTATANGAATLNWFAPTTPNTGSGFWINITQTGGSGGTSFSAASGAWTNITNGGITIGISGGSGTVFSVTGTYIIASDSGGVNQLGSGTITLTGSNIQSPTWNGTTPLILNGNGSATLNGGATSDWCTPNAANIGSGFWINITLQSATPGVHFSAAQGSWTNITNSGLTIDLANVVGNVGSVFASGTYQISNSSSGTPVLGSGTVTLNESGLTVIHLYTAAGSGTETILTNSTTCAVEVWSGVSGGGGASLGNGTGGGNGGGGAGPSYARSVFTVTGSAGLTMAYNVGAAGVGGSSIFNGTAGSGTAGGNSSVSSGTFAVVTVTCTAGGGGTGGTNLVAGVGGTAGSASGGNALNQSGGAGANGSYRGSGGNSAGGTFFGSPVHSGTPTAAGNNSGDTQAFNGAGANGSPGIVCFFYS